MPDVDAENSPELTSGSTHRTSGGAPRISIPGHLAGLEGRLARPFWGVLGFWSVFCGALATGQPRWGSEDALTLGLAWLLAALAWGSLWDLAAGTDWFRPLADDLPPLPPVGRISLPFTQSESPGGRVSRRLSQVSRWWRGSFWPVAGPALLGMLVAGVLAVVLSLLLPDRLHSLNLALLAFMVLGAIQRARGKDWLAGQALVLVGLPWLAGHLAFAELGAHSLSLAVAFSVAAWGALRLGQEMVRGNWLLNAGMAASVGLLVVVRQPLAAGAVGLLLFGQMVVNLSPRFDRAPALAVRRTWPWLMLAMLVAALALA